MESKTWSFILHSTLDPNKFFAVLMELSSASVECVSAWQGAEISAVEFEYYTFGNSADQNDCRIHCEYYCQTLGSDLQRYYNTFFVAFVRIKAHPTF